VAEYLSKALFDE